MTERLIVSTCPEVVIPTKKLVPREGGEWASSKIEAIHII